MRRPDVRNAFEHFVELRAELLVPNDPGKPFTLTADLRVSVSEFYDGDRPIPVAIKKLSIAVDRIGFDPSSLPRFGDVPRDNTVKAARTTTTVDQTSGSLKGKAAGHFGIVGPAPVASADASAAIEGAIARKTETKLVKKDTIYSTRVAPMPGLRWEVTEPPNQSLNGRYVEGAALCSLESRHGANRFAVSVQASVLQKDLVFNDDQLGFFGREKTRDRLVAIFMAKCATLNASAYAGRVLLSKVDIESDGQD